MFKEFLLDKFSRMNKFLCSKVAKISSIKYELLKKDGNMRDAPVGFAKNLFQTYNQCHNILRLFDVLPNFYFTARETVGLRYIPVA